jgi:hypothetical protein
MNWSNIPTAKGAGIVTITTAINLLLLALLPWTTLSVLVVQSQPLGSIVMALFAAEAIATFIYVVLDYYLPDLDLLWVILASFIGTIATTTIIGLVIPGVMVNIVSFLPTHLIVAAIVSPLVFAVVDKYF